ncbi:MAG: hypothetical protein LBQ57_04635, partial [Spirochaetales bacterium]|nr:hypothetical protein [Spirochaetales bacterium]
QGIGVYFFRVIYGAFLAASPQETGLFGGSAAGAAASRPFNPLRPTVFFGLWPLYTPKVFLGPLAHVVFLHHTLTRAFTGRALRNLIL